MHARSGNASRTPQRQPERRLLTGSDDDGRAEVLHVDVEQLGGDGRRGHPVSSLRHPRVAD
jgi:hypothetical protein